MKCKQQGYQWKPIQTRACRSCREEFSSRISSQVYCSPKCRPSTGGIHAANSTDRGYGSAHKRARLEWQAKVEAGVDCCLCGQPINPSESWHLDHTEDRTGYRGAAHPKCNLRDGQRGSALTTLAKHYDVDRDALIAWLSGQGRVGSLAA